MAGWMSRASSLFHQPPPPPEPFEVECDCGGKVAGHRLGNYQRPPCPVCERPVFVLPANVYPTLKTKTSGPAKPDNPNPNVGKKPVRNSPNQVIDENPQPAPAPKSPIASKLKGDQSPSKPRLTDPNQLQEPPKRLITPLRLVFLAIVVMSGLTVGGLWRRGQIENAKAIVTKAADAGQQSLASGDYITAAIQFERARKAVDLLGRTDDAARAIRQNSQEATALAGLSTSSLTECVEETLATAKPGQTDLLRMSSVIQGAWVIFDVTLSRAAEGQNQYFVDAPIVLKDGIVQIEIDSAVFKSIIPTNDQNESSRVIFAAQLESLSAYRGDPPTSVLTLNGKTAFLWSSYDRYAAIGYRPFDPDAEQQTRALLERQNQKK